MKVQLSKNSIGGSFVFDFDFDKHRLCEKKYMAGVLVCQGNSVIPGTPYLIIDKNWYFCFS
jgi:hypothetical protein